MPAHAWPNLNVTHPCVARTHFPLGRFPASPPAHRPLHAAASLHNVSLERQAPGAQTVRKHVRKHTRVARNLINYNYIGTWRGDGATCCQETDAKKCMRTSRRRARVPELRDATRAAMSDDDERVSLTHAHVTHTRGTCVPHICDTPR